MSRVTLHEGIIEDALREAISKIVSSVDLEKVKEICQENIRLASVDSVDVNEATPCIHEAQLGIELKVGFKRTVRYCTRSEG